MAVRRRSLGPTSRSKRGGTKLAIERLECRTMMAAQPVINEILAANNGVIQDADGDYSDFIELYNAGDQSIDLDGWYLTDDSDSLDKWEFPSVTLGAGQYLVVFASEKDRNISGSQLHTNFRLDAEGDFLALVEPDGATIASQFAPQYPQQFEDVSYGIATESSVTNVVQLGNPASVLIPDNGNLGNDWTQPFFIIDAAWQAGALGVGYSTVQQPPVSTTLLQIDFNDRGGPANTQPGFSSFVIGGSEPQIQSGSVTRTINGHNVTLTNASTFGFDDRRRSTPVNNGAFTEAQLLQDFVFSTDNSSTGTSGLDVRIDGLVAGATHTLTVWSFDTGSPGSRTSDWVANGIAIDDYSFEGAATPMSNETYRFGFVVAANAQGQILLQGRKDESTNNYAVFLNALRLETGDTLSAPHAALRVDFNDRTEGESGAANTEAGYSTMTLDDNGANFEGIEMTLSAFGGATFDDRDRTVPVDGGAFTLDQVYDDMIYTTGPTGSGMEILIEGLAPNVPYDLLLRSFDGLAAGTRTSTWTEVSSGQPVTIASSYSFNGGDSPTSNDDNAMRATLVSSPQGTLLLRGVQTTADRSVVVNAIELTRASFGELLSTDVKASMHEQNSSAYIRVPFDIADLSAVDQLLLDMHYDAGFVAYLNGQEVARRNAPPSPGVPPAFNASATMERAASEALAPETIDLTAFKHLLTQGNNNVLAVHGLNSAASDGDFLIAPRLRTVAVGSQALRYFETPSPGAPNGIGVVDFTLPVTTSVPHGFFDAPFSLELATATAGAQIYYTFDGSVPAPGNSAATLYTAPIFIDSTMVLRAAAVKEEFANSPVSTETYIFLEDVLTQDPLANPNGLIYPTIWQGNATADYEMDSRVVANWDDNNPANQDFGIREALLSLPTMSIVMDHDDLWNPSTGIYPDATRRGDAWRRPASVEYIDPSTGAEFQYNVGVQMHGEASRDNARLKKHSFRLIFNPEFDGPGRLNFPLFDNSEFADINTVVMRASFTDSFATRTFTGRYSPLDSTYTRDVWMRDMQLAMGSLSADSTYVHLYINGLYWGLYSPAERPDDAFLAAHIGGAEQDWDIIRDFNELFRGERTAYDAMFSLARQMPSSPNPNAIYQQLQGRNADGTLNSGMPVYLDVDNLIDYMILHLYAGAEDWPSHNWFAARNRVDPGTGFQFFVWDQEIVMDGRFRDRTEAADLNTPAELFSKLRSSSEFRLRFADRMQKHLFNDGALTNEAAQERWQWRADQVDAAIIGESARWGDAREGELVNVPPTTTIPLMTINHWRDSIADVRDSYIPQSRTLALSRFTADGLFPTLVAPSFSQHGGQVPTGYNLTMIAPAGTIWYTLDGSDPRSIGGGVSPTAMLYTGSPITITGTVTVRARALSGSQWSPLNEARFATEVNSLRISEVHYNPAAFPGVADRQDMEFFELLNTGTQAVSLGGVQIAGFADDPYVFASGLSLAPGSRIIVARDPATFQFVYGEGLNVAPDGFGPRNLSNGGEQVMLLGPLGEVLQSFTYSNTAPWPSGANGAGSSLEIIDPLANAASGANWRASVYVGGSPGASGIPGDYDGNSLVEQADYLSWKGSFGLSVARGTDADGSRDGVVNAADYVLWRRNLASTSIGSSAALPQSQVAIAGNAKPSGSASPTTSDMAFAILFDSSALHDASQPKFRNERNAIGPRQQNLLLAALPPARSPSSLSESGDMADDRAKRGSYNASRRPDLEMIGLHDLVLEDLNWLRSSCGEL